MLDVRQYFAEVIKAINLRQLLEDTVRDHAERTALITERQRVTYNQLDRAVNAVAGLINQSGVGKGDKVALMLPNIPEFVYCYFGALKIGAVVVTLNTLSTPSELTYLLNNSDSKLLITLSSAIKKYQQAQPQLLSCHQVIPIDSLNQNDAFVSNKNSKNLLELSIKIDPDDPAVMVYTAGLTGKPLGAVLTHRNLCSQANVIQSVVRRTPDDVGLSLIPLFHTFGATTSMLLAIRAGCSIFMMDRLTMDGLFSAIEKEKITFIAAVPRLFIGMIFSEKALKYDLSSLKICVTGGAPMPVDFIPVFEQKFGVWIYEGYGLTEASPVCTLNRFEAVAKPGSIGTPLPGIDIKIVDDTGRELPRNETGEVIIRGDNVMKWYYKDEAATAAVIKDGWLYTGDLGRMDEENYIFLTGLKKRMIITSGFNVYPREVETVLNLHPAIIDSRVSGKKDLMRGELVKADVVLKDGYAPNDKEIIRYCKIYLSNYKVPREVEFVQTISD
ncbi:MAG: AMP-binding protein [Smithella sp.]|jgi:long-chain acyl-CoA synthetase